MTHYETLDKQLASGIQRGRKVFAGRIYKNLSFHRYTNCIYHGIMRLAPGCSSYILLITCNASKIMLAQLDTRLD